MTNYKLQGAPEALNEMATASGYRDQKWWELMTINYLEALGVLDDPYEHYGKTLAEILDQWCEDLAYQGQKLLPILGACELFADFRALVVINPLGECSLCGCSVDLTTDGDEKRTWLVKTCSHCHHVDSDEPVDITHGRHV